MAVLTPPPIPTRDRLSGFRVPPVPPLPPPDENEGGEPGEPRAPMHRVSLPPDRLKTRLGVALFVSLLVNLAFYNQAAVWGKHVRNVFLRALHQQYVLPPAQIILVTPRPPAGPGGKTTYAPLFQAPRPLASPSPKPVR